MEFVEFLPLLHLQHYVEKELSHHQDDPKHQVHYINDHLNNNPRHRQFTLGRPYHHLSDSSEITDIYSDHEHHSPNNETLLSLSDTLINNLTNWFPGLGGGVGVHQFKGYQHTSYDEAANDQVIRAPTTEAINQLPLRHPIWGIVLLVILYSATFVVGVVGNCSVIFVVSRARRMRTVTNYFVVSLAIADLLVLMFCLIPNLVSNIFVPWVLGYVLCKTVPYIQGVSICASVYFLVAISLERCIAIEWPFKYQVTKEKAKLLICGIWLWSFIVALPWALFFQFGPFDDENPTLDFCYEIWPDKNWESVYFLVGNLTICYLFPLSVILVCYSIVWFRVYRIQVPSTCYYKTIELIHRRGKASVMQQFIVIILVFAISWFPLYAIMIRVKYFSESMTDVDETVIPIVIAVAQYLLCFSSSINFIVYSYCNKKFRKAFTEVIWGKQRESRVQFKHKSPTVNILLKRFNTYRVETTMSRTNDNDDSSDSI